ncbi:MAG TPA: cysteine desulfurase family protein [Bryobacteraceae bacterium]|nr:cysteine desulfurase family protein [Bryobacteraceae bacterium]
MRSFYFDYNATTPVAKEVLEVFRQALTDGFGNASSIHHLGQAAKQGLETARRQVCALIGCNAKELVFGSGGTEADNHALFGAVAGKDKAHIIVSAIEHPAVLAAASELKRRGHEISIVPVSSEGLVDPGDVQQAIRSNTALVSVMHVNNEIGTIQPIEEIAEIAHRAGALMHSDGVQAVGRMPVNVGDLGVDLYSMSAHKMRGPKGVGALFVRKTVSPESLLFGGRHEAGRRAGTENTPGITAMGHAAHLARTQLTSDMERIASLRDRLEQGILDRVPDVTVNGSRSARVSNTTNLCFEGIEGESLVIALDLKGFCVSSGSACSSGAVEPSHVLLALGLPKQRAKSSVRFSLGYGNSAEQVDELIVAVEEAATHLRRLSPTYIAHV